LECVWDLQVRLGRERERNTSSTACAARARTHTHTFCTLLICLTLWEYTSLQQGVDTSNGSVVRALGL
jgi:hypothetical protein